MFSVLITLEVDAVLSVKPVGDHGAVRVEGVDDLISVVVSGRCEDYNLKLFVEGFQEFFAKRSDVNPNSL